MIPSSSESESLQLCMASPSIVSVAWPDFCFTIRRVLNLCRFTIQQRLQGDAVMNKHIKSRLTSTGSDSSMESKMYSSVYQ